jgi:hypothetical protein
MRTGQIRVQELNDVQEDLARVGRRSLEEAVETPQAIAMGLSGRQH